MLPKRSFYHFWLHKYSKLQEQSTQRYHHENKCNCYLYAQTVGALWALCSLISKLMLLARKRRQTHLICHEKLERSIEDYVAEETAGIWNHTEDAETTCRQVQEDLRNAENTWSRTRMPEKTSQVFNAFRVSVSDLANSDDKEAGEVVEDN